MTQAQWTSGFPHTTARHSRSHDIITRELEHGQAGKQSIADIRARRRNARARTFTETTRPRDGAVLTVKRCDGLQSGLWRVEFHKPVAQALT